MTVVWPRIDWRRHLRTPLVIALLLSILLHLYVWLMAVLISAALKNGWLPPWMRSALEPMAALVQKTPPPNPTPPADPWQEIPLQFVEVDPAAASDTAPTDTKYYSTANTLAANPNPTKESKPEPKIDGTRDDTQKTFETTRATPQAQPPPPKPEETKPEETPAPPQAAQPERVAREAVESKPIAAGETQIAKADPKAIHPDGLSPQTPQEAQKPQEAVKPRRPKTLAEVRSTKGLIVGERMKQDGGVSRMALESSLNVKSSPLGDYNYRMVLAVQEQWYRLLEERRYSGERLGRVVITFELHSDGTITSLATKDTNVGDQLSFLCELAVMQPAPFGKWPVDVRRLIGGDTLPITFTFNYY
jgi:hypothetical protein